MFFEIAMGMIHLITFVMLIAYRWEIHDHVVKKLDGNRNKFFFVFWSFIISLWMAFIYAVVISVCHYVASSPKPYAWLTQHGPGFYFFFRFGIPVAFVIFFMILHIPVTFCCFLACRNGEKIGSFCIPGTCFTTSRFEYLFQSIAFYTFNSIPHIALLLITELVLRFSNSPIPSVIVLIYSIILLAVNIVVNAYVLYLITLLCKTKDDDGKSKTKDEDGKTKDDDSKTKDEDGKTKDEDGKTKDDDSKTKDEDGKIKDDDGKTKDEDGKTKDDDGKIKDGLLPIKIIRCSNFLFGIIIAVAANIITVLVVISLVDFFFSNTKETNYKALLPGVLLTVVGWYYKGKIAGIYAQLEQKDTDSKKDSANPAGGQQQPENVASKDRKEAQQNDANSKKKSPTGGQQPSSDGLEMRQNMNFPGINKCEVEIVKETHSTV